MANTPKKMKDPTEAALSAIQDALHVRDDDSQRIRWPHRRRPRCRRTRLRTRLGPVCAPAPKSDVYADEELRRPDDTASPRRPAANDDQESIGNILRTIQRRPAKTSYILASVFAAVWVIGGFLLGWLYLPEIQAALGPTGLTAPVLADPRRDLSRAGRVLLRARPHGGALAGDAAHCAVDGGSRDAARRAGDGRARVDRHRRSGDPPRSRGHGRRHRARAGARRRARDAGRQRGVGARTRLQRQRSAHPRAVAGPRRPARHAGRTGRADPRRHQRRASRPQPRHLADQPARRRAGQRRRAPHHHDAGRKGRAHHPRARPCRRQHDRAARRARRRPAGAARIRPAPPPPRRSPRRPTA